MSRGRTPWSAARHALDHPTDAHSIAAWIARYLEQQRVLGILPHSWERMRGDLMRFQAWSAERLLATPQELTVPILERYQRYLFYYRKANGEPLSSASQVRELARLKHWCRWLVRQRCLASNPAADLELPRASQRSLPQVLSSEEVETILAQPDTQTPIGLRDRAVLEVLYSTGIRRMELANLNVFDVQWSRGTLFVRQGKGRKDRVVPIGERALAWVKTYLDMVRSELVADPNEKALFLTKEGERVKLDTLSLLVRRTLRQAGIDKPGACHLFRHAAATFMLENGADIRYIQAMLGHTKLGTTELYTHVSIDKLRAIHAATHPGARLQRRRKDCGDPVD
jgi:integrase/recombinase XerD